NDCQRDLARYEQAAEPDGASSPGLAATSFQRLDQVQPRRADRRSDPEDQSGEDCKPGYECQHSPIDGSLGQPWPAPRQESLQYRGALQSNQEPQRATGESQNHAFGH